MKLSFSSERGRCAPVNSTNSVDVKGGRNEIWFSGVAITPNPCYRLTASFRAKSGGTIEIHIDKTPPPGYCHQCIGIVEFRGVLSEVPEGEYTVIVYIDEKNVYEGKITVS